MKPEFRVKVNLKGVEGRMNGVPFKGEFTTPLVDMWFPVSKEESTLFRLGRKMFALTIRQVKRVKKNGRS